MRFNTAKTLVIVPVALIQLAVFFLFAWMSFAQDKNSSGHIEVREPADLTPNEANQIYEKLKQDLAQRYAVSGLKLIDGYQSWKRYNSSPYVSATHGQRYVNSYANATGRQYGQLKPGERYPVGTVFAKDSITVTASGSSFPTALFVMEKLAQGTNKSTADWRYLMILPDGSIFGDTLGEEPEQVSYCHACHTAKQDDDYVFFVPEEFRMKP